MKADDLLDAIGELDELYLEPLEEKPKRRKIVWSGIGSLAACLLLFLFLPNGLLNRMAMQNEADYVSKEYTSLWVYYAEDGSLSSFRYEIHGGDAEMFAAWKNKNGIGADVLLKDIELWEAAPSNSETGYLLRVTLTASFSQYLEADADGLLRESLKRTVASYAGVMILDMELILAE